jgi:alkylation response protein AidB-like acyl-CoA dehydrogenase
MAKASQSASKAVGTRTESARTTDSGAILEQARRLAPLFRANAEANERQRMLTEETATALNDAGLFNIMTPKVLGGSELWPLDAIEAIETVSAADASTGWVMFAAAIAIGTGGAYLGESAVAQLFTGGHIPVIAGQGIPNGKAVPVKDGYRLSGAWSYGSGVKHSEYLHTGAVVFENGEPRPVRHGHPEIRIFVVPRAEAVLGDNWDVLGLRATASIDYTMQDVFVPAEFTHIADTSEPRRGGALFFLGIIGLAALGHAAFTLGVGRRMLDELVIVAQNRTSITGTPRESEGFLEAFAKAEAKYRAARALVYESWSDVQQTLERGDHPSTRQFTLIRLALNNATWSIAEVASFVYKSAGGIALRAGAIQRYFRDMHAATQHVTSSAPILRECGRELAGFAKGKAWGFIGMVEAD